MNLGVQDVGSTSLVQNLQTGWRAAYLPHWMQDSMGVLQDQVLVFKVGFWVMGGVKQALIHRSDPQLKHGAKAMFPCGPLSPEDPSKSHGKGGIISPFPHFPIV